MPGGREEHNLLFGCSSLWTLKAGREGSGGQADATLRLTLASTENQPRLA